MAQSLRGEVFMANLEPHEGSEQGGTRPVVIVSRDALNAASPVVVVRSITNAANKKKVYPSHVRVQPGMGGLTTDSIVICDKYSDQQDQASSKPGEIRQDGYDWYRGCDQDCS